MGTSHLGVPPSEHVVLEVVRGMRSGCGPAKLDFIRNLPDGSRESGPGGLGWRIPEGKLLVITDFDWQYIHPDGDGAAGQIEVLRLMIQPVGEERGDRVFESTIVLSSKGEGGTTEVSLSGVVVSWKAWICPDIMPGPLGPPSGLQHLIVRGYMVEAEPEETG